MKDKNINEWLGDSAEFEKFISAFETPQLRDEISSISQIDDAEVARRLQIYLMEMRFGFEFLSNHLPSKKLRILEVGAGLGLLSLYLAGKGHEVTALEPSDTGFDLFAATKEIIWTRHLAGHVDILEIGAGDLSPEQHGTFDFIFSVNVMEHIHELEEATTAISSVMSPGGCCVNTCANYIIPYEPHYGLIMIPFSPSLTRKIWRSRIDPNPDIWNTLNFITSSRVQKMANSNGLNVSFQPGTIHESLLRIDKDPSFAARHANTIVGKVHRLLSKTKILGLTRFIPAKLATPMVFIYTR